MNTSSKQRVKGRETQAYTMILFVVSDGSNSRRARENLERLCEQYLPGRHRIEIVDVTKDFQAALDHNVLLTPSVVVTAPRPRITVHGDLSDPRKFINALNLDKEHDDGG